MGIQRKFLRVQIPLLIGYRLLHQNEVTVSSLTDLSAGGARFFADASLKIGDRFELTLKLPWRESSLLLKGTVTRSAKVKNGNAYEIACKFDDLSISDTEEIAKVVLIFEREERLHKLLQTEGYE